ncbi:unnamed protein product [Clonostachys chloroleuca]|uniref:NB-ARC domain-containing protein n=1 Tax=Clonostachys chloroleuca TaxID=1926264 RepID=A0AA35MA59_9HYPO|nr:unnamed protein product [Clonostachys chloroleuca]
MTRVLQADDYTIAWVCVLEVEQIAAMTMLDELHQAIPQDSTDHNKYNLGSISGRNVVIAGLPKPGNNTAATIVTHMRRTFPNIEFGLLVGIGGGVPVTTDEGVIRLGHVVVSKPSGGHSGVVQYDQGKAEEGQFKRTGSIAPPPFILLGSAQDLAVSRALVRKDPVLENIKRIDTTIPGLRKFKYPGKEKDPYHTNEAAESEATVVVHRGTIASGSLVKNESLRDEIAKQYEVLCFETEAAGMLDDFPCMVIRGISDYCDSRKNNDWHGYAAAVAAAYTRQLISHLPLTKKKPQKSVPRKTPSYPQNSKIPVRAFVERVALRESVHEQLCRADDSTHKSTRKVGLWGLGGTGKTQLCLSLLSYYQSDYEATFWIQAGQAASVDHEFFNIFNLLFAGSRCASNSSMTVDEVVQQVHLWVSDQPGPWLFIFDGLDSIDDPCDPNFVDIQKYVPGSPNVHVIFTSRSQSIIEYSTFDGVSVGQLTEEEAIQIFVNYGKIKKLDSTTKENVSLVVKELGYLALPIALAGAYIAQTPRLASNLILFLDEYRTQQNRLLRRKPNVLQHQYDKSIMTTWEMTYLAVENEMPEACELLSLLSFFHHEDIYLKLLISSPIDDKDELDILSSCPLILETGEADIQIIEDSLAILERYALLLRQPNEQDYHVHTLVHAWGRLRITDSDQEISRIWAITTYLIRRIEKATRGWTRDPSEKARLLPHLVQFVNHFKYFDMIPASRKSWLLLSLLEFEAFAVDAGRFREAAIIGREALKRAQTLFGDKDEVTLQAMIIFAVTLAETNELVEAEALTEKAIETLQEMRNTDPNMLLIGMGNLALIYSSRGDDKKAVALMNEVLERYQKTEENSDAMLWFTMHNLASISYASGDTRWSLEMRKTIFQNLKNIRGENHPETLVAMKALTRSLRGAGKYEEALSMSREVLSKMEMVLGHNDPHTIAAMLDIGTHYSELGDFDTYLDNLRTGLQVAVDAQASHLTIFEIKNNIVYGLREQGNLEEAEEKTRELILETQGILGKNHPISLLVLHNLAATLNAQGKKEEALNLCQDLLSQRRKIIGHHHHDTIASMHLLAWIKDDLDMVDEATELKQEVFNLRTKLLGEDHHDTLWSMNNLAISLRKQGRLNEAESVNQTLLAKRQKIYGNDHPHTLEAMKSLMFTLAGQEKSSEAMELARRLVEGHERHFGKDHLETLQVTVSYIKALASMGGEDEISSLLPSLLPRIFKNNEILQSLKEGEWDQQGIVLNFETFKLRVTREENGNNQS